MANTNPQSAPVTAQSLRKYNRILYMHQIISGPDYNQVNIANPEQPEMFAYTNVHDYPLYDSLGPGKKLVAHAQGLHTKTCMSYNGWFHWSSIVFTDERFQGSSLKTIGNQEGDWAIMGGTGVFTFAQGTVTTCRIQDNGFSNIKEVRIDALCCTPNSTPTEGSNSSSNISGLSMDCYPQNRPVTQQSEGTVFNRKLYMHQIFDGPDYNQVNIANLGQPQMFGCTNVHDYPIYDSLDPNAKIVARAQGLHTETCLDYDNWFHWSRLVFHDESFEGSSFIAIGDQNKITGEWAIVGGTGVFAFAKGTITICRVQDSGSSNIKEICIRALAFTGQATPIEIKVIVYMQLVGAPVI
ncbi:uncharacterized protein [Miscanthus floridulus]|uniref:uncharacterized protein n=1 Tax=Miscanthus floridulus TaxID=154761 RepID=UPI0034574686